MQNLYPHWIGPLALCLLLLGCGDGSSTQDSAQSTPASETDLQQALAIVVATSEPTYWREGEAVCAIDDVRQLVLALEPAVDRGYALTIDESFERSGQLSVLLDPPSGSESEIDLLAESDNVFAQLKQVFDERAKQALIDELAFQEAAAKEAADKVRELQKALQNFQDTRRGIPATDASRLERRKIDRQIENALNEQIAIEKQIESLNRRINREQFVTLIRVR